MNATRRTVLALALIAGAALSTTLLPPMSDPISLRAVGLFVLVYLLVFLAAAVVVNASPPILKQIVRIGVSAIPAFIALFPLAALFDRMNWPVFHSWGLAHGSFLIAVPVIASPVYVLLGLIPGLRERDDLDAA